MTLPEYSPAVYALLRVYRSDGHHMPSTDDDRMTFRFLRQEQLLTDHLEPHGHRLTAKGLEALRQEDVRLAASREAAKEFKEQSQREAEEKSDEKSRSWWQFWLGIILGWLLGCITPSDVIDFFLALLH